MGVSNRAVVLPFLPDGVIAQKYMSSCGGITDAATKVARRNCYLTLHKLRSIASGEVRRLARGTNPGVAIGRHLVDISTSLEPIFSTNKESNHEKGVG